ncbi:Dienelactone hydrolase [Nannocystis exedens]|uniref:Dienelactone hydrolase n=1 Tax=Nannocystis exedens TaxID=54 RepID=A0A1I2F8F4_9BACT|nr:dienelactone hydrolase family protein [Nannocystis exedens]PCC73040.1 dienelactone hydrolase [Nannocystis exedens]SFF01077.1 Dienelactone hydrolase [Nannocystis exedens]
MKSTKILTLAATTMLGLGLTGVKTVYGAEPAKPGKNDDTDRVVEIDGEAAAPKLVDFVTDDIVLPADEHAQRLALPARVYKPKFKKGVGPGPAVLVMHGSGGLHKMPNGNDAGACSRDLEDQYDRWGKDLARRGYVVLMPSSYTARGFCDMHSDEDRIPEGFDKRPEAILSRLYDMDVAARYLCDMDEVDCERMGVLGFSHGATMAMLALHWQMDHAIEYYRDHVLDPEIVGFEVKDLPEDRPQFKVGVAYYPGCGTDGFLPKEIDERADIRNKYFPTADLYVLHASRDELARICTVDESVKDASGEREIQSAQVAAELGVDDRYNIEVYERAGHGFDSDEKEANEPGNFDAAKHARSVALHQLYSHLN